MVNNSRTENSIKNSMTSVISNLISIIMSFIGQTLFVKILGAEYLGLNGLFSNVLTMLSLADLGLGSAIIFHMYKPIAENNEEKIKSLVQFYRKAYIIIALIILFVGLSIMPLLHLFVDNLSINTNIYVVFLLQLLNTVASYIMIYKRSIIYAYQKNYIINIVHSIYIITMHITQIIILLTTKNYYFYLISKIICQILENYVLNIICNKKYRSILYNGNKLDKKTEKSIFEDVKALIFHKIGSIIVFGTDNLIISKYLGVIVVGLYSNYNLIINAVYVLFGQVISSITASIGNLIVTSDQNKIFSVFKRIRFINFWISCFSATSILLIMQSFIKIWIGEEYLLGLSVLIILAINFFQQMQRSTYSTFKDSAGIWKPDRFIPIIESILNILFSITLVNIFGLLGVFIGTFISGLIIWSYSYPKFVYKRILGREYKNYFLETMGYFLVFCIIAAISFGISVLFKFNNGIIQVVVNCIISLIIPNLLIFIIFKNKEEFKYCVNLIKNIILKFKNKKGLSVEK